MKNCMCAYFNFRPLCHVQTGKTKNMDLTNNSKLTYHIFYVQNIKTKQANSHNSFFFRINTGS